jgi:predicted  nucleic acid-binding Zn-ribbon protein
MAFERLKAEISLLVTQMENQPDDKHELYLQLREKLNEMRVTGMPLPQDLLELERTLEAEFSR